MSITLVWRTDVHMSDRSPSSRTDDWNETVLGKLGQVRDLARSRSADAILDGGDFFHNKSPSRNSHETIRRVADHHAAYPCPVFCCPGNHDAVFGDYAFLGQQPLGVLFSTGVFQRLYDEYELFIGPADASSNQTKVYPYNRKGHWADGNPFAVQSSVGTPVVRVVGIPYHGNTYDMDRFHSIKRGEEDFLICVAHVLASEKGGTMFEGEDIVKYSDLLDTAPDLYCFGHWHKDQGVEHLGGKVYGKPEEGKAAYVGGKTFINIGSLTRGALSEDEVQRRPASAVIRIDKTDEGPRALVEVVRLDVKPAGEVFDVEKRAQQVKRQSDMNIFVSKIQESLKATDEDLDLSESVRTYGNLPEEIRERALLYIEKADG